MILYPAIYTERLIMLINVFPDQKGRWHWHIHEVAFENMQASVGIPIEGCCSDKGGGCNGFDSRSDAENTGRAYAEAHKIQ
jgi:hypothetical protein